MEQDLDYPSAAERPPAPPAAAVPAEPVEDSRMHSPEPGWPAWTAPLALVAGIVLAAVAGLIVDLPAFALGVSISSSHTPPGLAIADTFVQDLAFVAAAVWCARLGGRRVRAWQFGLRPPGAGWRRAAGLIALLLACFLGASLIWAAIFHPSPEKLLEQLGTSESTLLLVLSAALTCVVAPMCEEFLFRGYMFTALRSWRGTVPAAIITGLLFGGVHAGSAPVLDLAPLAFLGFALCLLYRATGSLYPCMLAHALNNSIAFSSLEEWNVWQGALLTVAALCCVGAVIRLWERFGPTAVGRAGAPATGRIVL